MAHELGQANSHANSYPNSYCHSNPHCHRNSNCHRNSDSYRNIYPDSRTERHASTHSGAQRIAVARAVCPGDALPRRRGRPNRHAGCGAAALESRVRP